MGSDRVRHLRARTLKGGRILYYWQPSATLRACGLAPEPLGADAVAAKRRALELNALADGVRTGRNNANSGERNGSIAHLVADYRCSAEWGGSRVYKGLKPRTRSDYEKWLAVFASEFGHLQARAITANVLRAWRDRVAESSGAYQAYHALGAMRALWAWAERYDWVGESPARKVENPRPPKRDKQWPERDRALFIAAAEAMGHDVFAAAFMVADNIAQSPGDVWGLTVGDFSGGAIDVTRRKTGVGGPPIPLWPEVTARLTAYLEARKASLGVELHAGAPLFADRSGKPFAESTRHKIFRDIRAKAGVSRLLQWQDLRRTAATEAAAGGATQAQIRALLRHKTDREAATYVRPDPATIAGALAKRRAVRNKGG